jgi:hypothetical protein
MTVKINIAVEEENARAAREELTAALGNLGYVEDARYQQLHRNYWDLMFAVTHAGLIPAQLIADWQKAQEASKEDAP